MWVHRKGIANILSFHNIQNVKDFESDYTSRPIQAGVRDNAFRVESPDKIQRWFIPDGHGLYHLDCAQDFSAGKSNVVFGPSIINTESNLLIPSPTSSSGVSLQIETVGDNKSKFTKHDIL